MHGDIPKGIEAQERIIDEYIATGIARLDKDDRDYSRTTLLDWPWLYVIRHRNYHFDEQEIVIELRLPWSIGYNINNGPWHPKVHRSLVIAFGRAHTRLTKGGWQARGALSVWECYL